jgi:hypothetical protein
MLLSEAILHFIKRISSGFIFFSEPNGEITAMINLLMKWVQLLINNFALIDYCDVGMKRETGETTESEGILAPLPPLTAQPGRNNVKYSAWHRFAQRAQ